MSYNWATYQSATGCTRYGPAGAQALLTYLEDCFPDQTSYGICNCRQVRGGASYSHHAECRAYDEGFAVFEGQDIGVKTLEKLGPHGKRLGIDHMIVNHQPGAADRGDPRIYSARSPSGRTYTGTHPHKNHNHIGLTRGAGVNLTYATLVEVVGEPSGLVESSDMAFTKGLTEAQWRALYQAGIAKGASEQAVVDYWVRDAANRSDTEHDTASASLFTELATRPGGFQFTTEKVEVVKSIRLQ